MNYNIASKSEKGRKKERFERNGDCCGWIEQDGWAVLALADGVGSCADDARASRTTSDLFLEKCQAALKDPKELTEERLAQFCREIDPVLAVDGDMACFCVVVWNTKENRTTWLHVGDTRIYKYSKAEGLVLVTEDDHGKAVNIKINGKLYTDHGAVVSAMSIDNAIGDRNCDFHTGSFGFNPGESIILCSDGMYNSSTFNNDVELLLDEADLTNGTRRINTTDDDDNSLLVLRWNMIVREKKSVHDLMDNFERHKNRMPFNTLIDMFFDEVETCLDSSSDIGELAQIVSFVKDRQLFPDKTRIDRVFNKAVRELNEMSAIEEKQRFNMVCNDLKDILRYVFTH